jgi:hypothetical protein
LSTGLFFLIDGGFIFFQTASGRQDGLNFIQGILVTFFRGGAFGLPGYPVFGF